MTNLTKTPRTLAGTMLALALAAALVFALASCPSPSSPTPPGGTTGNTPPPAVTTPRTVIYESADATGNLYTLEITENLQSGGRYAAKSGDSFKLTIELFNNGNYTVALTCSGTIGSATPGNESNINISITVNGQALTIAIQDGGITSISGKIVGDNGGEITAPAPGSLGTVFADGEALGAWLAAKPANTAATPYTVKLRIREGDLTFREALQSNADKYVKLEFLPDVTSLAGDVFWRCTSIVGIHIPASVTSIGGNPFSYCTGLTKITIDDNHPTFMVDGYGLLNDKNRPVLLIYPAGKTNTSFNIFPGGENAPGIEIIGNSAFRGCTSLKSVTIPASVTGIANSAFRDTGLTNVVIPDSVNTPLGERAFANCASLASVTIGSGVDTIREAAFERCTSLASVTIGSAVNTIGNSAFAGCTSLERVAIPASVTSIGVRAFFECSSLTSITVDTGNTAYSSEGGVLYDKAKTFLMLYPAGKTSASFNIPGTVAEIGGDAFRDCAGLTGVTIPTTVTGIGNGAFLGTGLTSVTIPASVTSIGGGAFRCFSLVSVTLQGTIPSSGLHVDAFDGIGDLRDKYLAGGPGTYTRASGGTSWTKQP